jgi:hypothetical protein
MDISAFGKDADSKLTNHAAMPQLQLAISTQVQYPQRRVACT